MNPKRKRRLYAVGFIVAGLGVAVGLALFALRENINLFYPPDAIVAGEAPVGVTIRAGGMVREGSLERGPGLDVRFVVSDLAGHDVPVRYRGILPDLFREGQGVVATGKLRRDGVFEADEVLAKHDENYMPPELATLKGRAEAGGG